MNIDWSIFTDRFQEFCNTRGITFESQKQAIKYYNIWHAGVIWVKYGYR